MNFYRLEDFNIKPSTFW